MAGQRGWVCGGVDGASFSNQLRRQETRFAVEMLQTQEVTAIHSHRNYRCMMTASGGEHSARALLLAAGSNTDGWASPARRSTSVPGFTVTAHALAHEERRPAGNADRDPHPLETSIPAIIAAGDSRAGSPKQVASAADEGATAALLIREYLETAGRA